MTNLNLSDAVLILVDVQQGFDNPKWGPRNNPDAETNIARLLQFWRSNARPVLHVQHCSVRPNSPLRPELPGCQFKSEATPIDGEPIFQKTVNSAFIGTNLEGYLRDNRFQKLVVVGLTTNHCISTTVRMAGNLGFDTFVVADATATFDRQGYDGKMYSAEEVHAISLASLHKEFATVLLTDDILENQ